MSQHDTKIVEKIRKLLALSRSKNIHEAASAAAAAQEMMQEHRLALADVELPPISELTILDHRLMSIWRWGLLTACARSYYCGCLRIEEDMDVGTLRVTGLILGTEDDCAAVKCLYEHMASEIDRLSEEKFFEDRPPGSTSFNDVLIEQSWKRGATRAITENLEKARRRFERDTDRAIAAGSRVEEAVRAYQKSKYPRTHRPKMDDHTDESVFRGGYKVAMNLDVPDKTRAKLDS